jgi:nicotinate-nucleotide adenylyltransferase
MSPEATIAPGPLGVFGGTFDPVHLAHLRLAEEARDHLQLTAVRWIPAGQPYHREAPPTAAADRLAMVQLAVADNPAFTVDAAEVHSGQPSYTVPTLERLRAELGPDQPLVLLLGADAFAGIPSWHRWQELFGLAHLAVAHRPGYPLEAAELPPVLAAELTARQTDATALRHAPAGAIVPFAMTPLAVSATHIRALLAAGNSARYLLQPEVAAYIAAHRLYRP